MPKSITVVNNNLDKISVDITKADGSLVNTQLQAGQNAVLELDAGDKVTNIAEIVDAAPTDDEAALAAAKQTEADAQAKVDADAAAATEAAAAEAQAKADADAKGAADAEAAAAAAGGANA